MVVVVVVVVRLIPSFTIGLDVEAFVVVDDLTPFEFVLEIVVLVVDRGGSTRSPPPPSSVPIRLEILLN